MIGRRLQARIKSLAAAEDAKKLKPLRRLTLVPPEAELPTIKAGTTQDEEEDMGPLKYTITLDFLYVKEREGAMLTEEIR